MTKQTKNYGVYHWDTFDNATIMCYETDDQEDAEKFVMEKYKGHISPAGADRVDIVSKEGRVVRTYSVR